MGRKNTFYAAIGKNGYAVYQTYNCVESNGRKYLGAKMKCKGFRSFDDCACISCADDTLESFDQALEVAMESFGVDMDVDTERDMREIFVNYQNYLETGA